MAKSIWKPGVKITRKEKKALRRLMPHPNRGRRLYQWKAENARISRAMEGVMNDDGTLNLVEVAKRTVPVSTKLTMKREFTYTQPHNSTKFDRSHKVPIFTEVDNVSQDQGKNIEELRAGYQLTVTSPELAKTIKELPSEIDPEKFKEICDKVIEQHLIDRIKNGPTDLEIKGVHLRGQASDVSSVPKE